MYYLSINGKDEQFKNAQDYCLAYAKFYREKVQKLTTIELIRIINLLKKEFNIVKEMDDCEPSNRLAVVLSEKQGTVKDLANFLILIFYGLPEIKTERFRLLLSARAGDAGIEGTPQNPIKHYGIRYRITTEEMDEIKYIDLNLAFQEFSEVEIHTNKSLRERFKDDFEYSIVDIIWDMESKSIEELYNKLLFSNTTKSGLKI